MSVEFDPVPLGRPRRRLDPLVIVVAVVVAGLGLAVLKPWESREDTPNGVAAASPSSAASADADGADAHRIEALVDGTARRLDVVIPSLAVRSEPSPPTLSWADIQRSPYPRAAYSIGVVTVDWSTSTGSAGYPVYFEGWYTPRPDAPTVLETYGQSIVGLGVATADGAVAQDVRIYRVRADGGLDWIHANPVGGGEVDGALVLAIPGEAIAFSAGRYRVDALVDGAIRRVDVAIPGLDGTVPPPIDPAHPDVSGLVPLRSSDPSEVLSGPFVTVGGRGVPLDVAPVDPLDETGAWLDGLATPDSADRPTVARVYQPRATGLGVMLTSHARIERAGIVRLAPDVLLGSIATVGGVSYNHGGTPWIGFAAPDLGAWPPGDYAMTVVWSDGDGRHDRTWHVELRPGPSTPSAPAPG